MWHEAHGAQFRAAQDMIVAWERRERRPYEPETWAFIEEVLDRRSFAQAVDVGAATGWYAIPLAMRGLDVWAFEPNPRVFARLCENARRNGRKFRAHKLGLSNRTGAAVFWHNPAVPLTSGGSIETPTCNAPVVEQVRVAALDDWETELRDLGLMKIDVEGHEAAVLAGAARVLTRNRPALIVEANTDRHREHLAAWFEEARYEWRVGDRRNMLATPL